MRFNFYRGDKYHLEQVRLGDDQAMEQLYFSYREEFIHWSSRKFGLSQESALDLYQETITLFFEKAIDGSMGPLESSIKTYLFGIGKNLALQKFDKESRAEKHSADISEHYRFLAENKGAQSAYDKAKETTQQVFSTIGEPCKTVLKLFYFEKKSMSQIAQEMGYKSEGVVRTTKKRCLGKIRASFLKPADHE